MSDRIGNLAVALFAATYAASLIYLDRRGALPVEEAATLFIVLGLGFSFLAWLTTIGIKPIPLRIERPTAEGIVALLLVAMVAGYLVYGRTWVDAQFPGATQGGSALGHQIGVTVAKLAVFVVFPFLVYRFLFGQTASGFGLSRVAFARLFGRDGVAALIIAAAICLFQFYAGRAAAPIRDGIVTGEALWLGGAVTFLWLLFDVGLTEELFFRGMLQERLAALLRSPLAGLMLMALFFGLIHAPGIVLRGAGDLEGLGSHPDWLTGASYTIAVQAVAAFFFGIVWMRTRNLAAVIVIHAATDLLAHLPRYVKMFGLVS
jgi:membrane protease YdiL (CAAX protease family)